LGLPLEAWVVLGIGLAFRAHAFVYTPVINPDGALYIQQARALWYGLKGQVLACYSYLSIYPILIYLSHFIFKNWVVAAKAVSLFFGTLSMLPLFGLAKKFMNTRLAALCMLAVAINPSFVAGSSSVQRDPVYLFFASLGIFLFVLSLKEEKPAWMILSAASLLLAAWARIEAVVFIAGSAIFIILRKELRWKNLAYFLFPIVMAGFIGLAILLEMGQMQFKLMGLNRVLAKATGAISSYNVIRGHLKELIEQWSQTPGGYSMMHFFMRTRNVIWLIALASLVIQIKRGFFWPVFIFFIFGLPSIRKMMREYKELAYLLLLGMMGFFALYVQILSGWAMESRFIALFLIPTLPIVGFGVEAVLKYVSRKFGWKQPVILLLLGIFLIAPGVYKELKASSDHNIILKKIGEAIARKEREARAVEIAGTLRRMQLVHFYANLPYQGAPCFDSSLWLKPRDTSALEKAIDQGIEYFVYDEGNWSSQDLVTIEKKKEIFFETVQTWETPGFGKVRLLRIKRE